MDLQFLVKILLRRKWLILASVLIPAIATFLLVSKQDKSYKSDAIVTTGIIGAGLNPEAKRSYVQDNLLTINFNQQIETMQSKGMLRLLTYQMLIHDLSGKEEPFRTIEEDAEDVDYSPAEIQEMLAVIKHKFDTLDTRVMRNIKQEKMYKNLSKALEYDYKSLTKNLVIYRKGETDYIAAEYSSENPYLSAYLVNELTERFLTYNKYKQEKEYLENYKFARNQVVGHKIVVDSIKFQLNQYRQDNQVVDMDSESSELVGSISDLEMERAMTATKIESNRSAIAQIDISLRQKKQEEAGSESSKILDNDYVKDINARLKSMRTEYVETGDPELQKQIVLLRNQLDEYFKRTAQRESVSEGSTGVITRQMIGKLENEKHTRQLELIEAEKRVASLNESLAALNQKRNKMSANKGVISRLEGDLEVTKKEYEGAVSAMNQSKSVLDKAAQPIQIVEYAQVADKAESSNRALFTAFAGVVGGAFSVMSLLMLAFVDISLNTPHQFKKFADVELIGTLNEINNANVDLNGIFNSNGKNTDLVCFKESIRNIRFAIEQSGANTFLFTSTKEQQGKTFMMITLAYALTLKDKKVLLIDTNFKNNTLTQMSEKAQRKNLLTTRLIGKNKLGEDFESKSGIGDKFTVDHVDIIGNRGGNNSPSEIFAGKNFKDFVGELSQSYDYIFMEGASLNTYADTRELTEYVDKVITVFSAETSINEKDKNSIEFLKRLSGKKMMGAILNKLEVENLN